MAEDRWPTDCLQVDTGFAYADKDWETIRQTFSRVVGRDADVETIPSNTINAKTRQRIPAPLRLILENAARTRQNSIRFSSNLKDDRAAVLKDLRSAYCWIDKARVNCEEIIGAGTLGVDMSNLENAVHSLSEAASYCTQEIEALRYRPEGNQSASKGVNDYFSELAEIWDRIEADPKLKRTWQRRFMTLAAAPFLGPDAVTMIESWSRQQRMYGVILKA
jgi:hypothetical protein